MPVVVFDDRIQTEFDEASVSEMDAPPGERPSDSVCDGGLERHEPTSMAVRPPPLCVDLDGTLIRADLLHEALITYVREHPWSSFKLAVWAMKGRDVLKAELAARVCIRADVLPYRSAILDYVAAHRLSGGSAYLVTASPSVWADTIADHLNLFDGVSGSERGLNLKGETKARHLVARFGEQGFDYIGDSRHDRPVWQSARRSLGAGARSAGHLDAGAQIFTDPDTRAGSLLKALRPHQWLKNLLVFVALFAAHQFDDLHAVGAATLGFVAFCCCASSAYVVNDLFDLEVDRLHPRKRYRPFAAGAAPVMTGLMLAPMLAMAGALICLALPPLFAVTLATYLILTHAYSWTLKRRAPVDVFTLATLYTLRVIAGAASIGAPPSLWLLAFSLFLFLGLATLKRHSELLDTAARGNDVAAGRGYWTSDGPILVGMGVASGFCAVLVFSLYVGQSHVAALYRTPALLWFICPLLLYWTSRMWLLAQRGQMHDDPVVLAVRDPISRKIIALCAVLVFAAAKLSLPLPVVGT